MNDTQPTLRRDMIRQWARERSLAIGSRGRLPQSIVEAFQRENATSTANDASPEDNAHSADPGFGPIEPLARYLEPQFGNIYDWDNAIVPYDQGSIDIQPWTDEVRQAIRNYLLHEAPEQLLDRAFPARRDAQTEDWADEALEGYQPWEVALRFHEAAVASLPTLDALVGHLQTWPYENDREDAIYWLEQHATETQLGQIAVATEQTDLTRRSYYANLAFDLVQRLDPPQLLSTWHDVIDSAASDLADAEWELLKPLLPAPAGYDFYNRTRAAINGMLYQRQKQCPWSAVPIRYGRSQTTYFRHRTYKRTGVFRRMHERLEGKPEAARLVAWLRHEVGTAPANAENGTLDT